METRMRPDCPAARSNILQTRSSDYILQSNEPEGVSDEVPLSAGSAAPTCIRYGSEPPAATAPQARGIVIGENN